MDKKEILEQLFSAVRKTGEFIAKEFATFSKEKAEKKAQNDMVSYVDREAEKQLVSACKDIVPKAGFIREEGEDIDADKEFVWVIDPLDGTNNFVHGVPVFSISIALMQNKEPVLGIVYNIPLQEMFYAAKGEGAFLNGEAIRVTSTEKLSEALIATGFPYRENDNISDYLRMLGFFMKSSRALRRMGSAAIDLAYVAAGRFDFFFEGGLSPWDVAAGALLVQEAGGKVSDYSGGNNHIFGKSIIASNPYLYPKVLNTIKGVYQQENPGISAP